MIFIALAALIIYAAKSGWEFRLQWKHVKQEDREQDWRDAKKTYETNIDGLMQANVLLSKRAMAAESQIENFNSAWDKLKQERDELLKRLNVAGRPVDNTPENIQ